MIIFPHRTLRTTWLQWQRSPKIKSPALQKGKGRHAADMGDAVLEAATRRLSVGEEGDECIDPVLAKYRK